MYEHKKNILRRVLFQNAAGTINMGADISDHIDMDDDDIWFHVLENDFMDSLRQRDDLISTTSAGLITCYAELHRIDLKYHKNTHAKNVQ